MCRFKSKTKHNYKAADVRVFIPTQEMNKKVKELPIIFKWRLAYATEMQPQKSFFK